MSSNEPRDQLADQLLAVMYEADTLVRVDLADAIIAAGWRPPPRVIEGAELAALPVSSVVEHTECSEEGPCIWTRVTSDWWCLAGTGRNYSTSDIEAHRYMQAIASPLTVLHEPEDAR